MARHLAIDKSGRLVLPKRVREDLHLQPGSRLRLEQKGSSLVLTPEAEETALAERHGLLVVTGEMMGGVPDHREIREARSRRHGRRDVR
jgi:AbrB family looped-hinge helix DNA binding protein